MVSTEARWANGMEGFPAQEASSPGGKSSPHSLPWLETVLRTSGCQDPSPRPPCARHRTPSRQRFAIFLPKVQGHPATRKQSLDYSHPLDNERKQETGKCLVNRKSGAGARPPRMRTHACKKAGSSRWTMAELGEADEAELQRLVAAEQQKAQFTAQVRGQGPRWRERRLRLRLTFQALYSAREVTAARKKLAELCHLATGRLPSARSCCARFFSEKK